MLTVEQALESVLSHARPLPAASRTLEAALGCVLADDAIADMDSPPFDKSLVDGYAVRSRDLEGSDRRLAVGEAIMAGQTPSRALRDRESALVMTGAMVPGETDAVVMHEKTRRLDGGIQVLEERVRPGQNLLCRGGEMRLGEVVVARGSILTPARLGLLAATGHAQPRAFPRPRVVIVPTGDELVEPGCLPGPGQIRNSNTVMLHALAIETGAVAETRAVVRDDPEELRRALGKELASDLLVITGGVSAGQRDLVPPALEALGVECVFHKVRLKPGKPLWFGVGPRRGAENGSLVFGLPGNPVSGLVGFLLFVRAALGVLAGKRQAAPVMEEARLSGPFRQRGDRSTFHPARLVTEPSERMWPPLIETLVWSGSADLRTAAAADGFAVFAAGEQDYRAGQIVPFLPMR
jgi:molybdopterin molybdotransferase